MRKKNLILHFHMRSWLKAENQHLQKKIRAEEKGEEKFVPLKQRATDVAVQVIGEVIGQVLKPPLQDLGLVTDG